MGKRAVKRKAKAKAKDKAQTLANGMRYCEACEKYARSGRIAKVSVYRGRWFCTKCWASWDEQLPSEPVEMAMDPGHRLQMCQGPPEILVVSFHDTEGDISRYLPSEQERCGGKFHLHPMLLGGMPVWWKRVGKEACRFIYKDKDVGWMIADRTPKNADDENEIFFTNFDAGSNLPHTFTGNWLRFNRHFNQFYTFLPGNVKVSPIRRFQKSFRAEILRRYSPPQAPAQAPRPKLQTPTPDNTASQRPVRIPENDSDFFSKRYSNFSVDEG